jgi:hypothetical protein
LEAALTAIAEDHANALFVDQQEKLQSGYDRKPTPKASILEDFSKWSAHRVAHNRLAKQRPLCDVRISRVLPDREANTHHERS